MSAVNADLGAILWRTVELHRVTSGPKDRYGVVTYVEGAAESVPAYFEVTETVESAGTDRERRETALLVLWPDVDPKARDVVDVDGERWQIDGPPRTLDALLAGAPHHTEATLVRVREGP